MHGTSDTLFMSHLQEYMWHHNFGDNAFGNIIVLDMALLSVNCVFVMYICV